jgi:hypothetical protein
VSSGDVLHSAKILVQNSIYAAKDKGEEHYPLAQTLACVGFVFVLLVEKILLSGHDAGSIVCVWVGVARALYFGFVVAHYLLALREIHSHRGSKQARRRRFSKRR